jgi:cyclophilin family peptidyl-prolyl cis-trans isomerase
VKNFVIQGGDPKGDGTGGSDKKITGEFAENGVQNDLSHLMGVISMARKGSDKNSATSQFFICNSESAAQSLDGKYAGFGYVVAGMEVVLTISDVEVKGETPVEKVVIESITFVTPVEAATEAPTSGATDGTTDAVTEPVTTAATKEQE